MRDCTQNDAGKLPARTVRYDMAFDYKKAYKEFYLPPQKPQLLTIQGSPCRAVCAFLHHQDEQEG